MEQGDVVTDVITCNALISAWEKGKQPERALQVEAACSSKALCLMQ